MGEGHEMRWGGLAGTGAVILAIVGRIVLGGLPRVTDPTGVIAMYLAGHRGQIMWGTVLYAIAAMLLLWFGAALSTAFRRADETSDAPTVVLAGIIVIAAIGLMTVGVFAGMTYALTANPALLLFATAPYSTLTIVGTVGWVAVALTLAAAAVAIMHTRVFPTWMAWFAAIVALVDLLASFTLGITSGPLAPSGWLETYVPGVLTALWVLAASGLLVREHLPVMAMRAPHAMGPGRA